MLSGRLRALGVLAAALPAPRATVSRLEFRVWPTDVDLNVHLTNSRYPQLMDLGRLDLLVRSGVLGRMLLTDARPIAVETGVVFQRELRLGALFSLETRAVGRDRKAVVFEQRFLVKDDAHAVGRVKVLVVRRGKVIEPKLLAGLLD